VVLAVFLQQIRVFVENDCGKREFESFSAQLFLFLLLCEMVLSDGPYAEGSELLLRVGC
jgi:hypothetical protein